MPKTVLQEFTKGLWTEIPPYRLVLGICPTLAMSKGVDTGFGMGVAVTFVLVCSNVLISVLRKLIPRNVRIACFIVVVATFVIVVELLMQAYTYPLFLQMGIFIPLIVVNCIPLGRAEAFCYKNGVLASFADGLGMVCPQDGATRHGLIQTADSDRVMCRRTSKVLAPLRLHRGGIREVLLVQRLDVGCITRRQGGRGPERFEIAHRACIVRVAGTSGSIARRALEGAA